MDTTYTFPAASSPLTALTATPDRVQPPLSPLPQSPSLPSFSAPRHFAANSDVQAMVSRFNALDIRDHAALRKKESAALRRAELGREEAEGEARRARVEVEGLRREVEEGKGREGRVAERCEGLLEDLHREKETGKHAQALYEKEVRRARKETFKASSAVVKLQEELKAARNALRGVQGELETERGKAAKGEKRAFEAEFAVVGVQEELARALARVKVVEEERDALKMSLREEEVARIAAEGRVALPSSPEEEEEEEEGGKRLTPVIFTPIKEEMSGPYAEVAQLRETLMSELARREAAEGQVEFMKMECQFQCCSCRLAERHGVAYVHDSAFEVEVRHIKDAIAEALTPPPSIPDEDLRMELEPVEDIRTAYAAPEPEPEAELVTLPKPEAECITLPEPTVLMEKPALENFANIQNRDASSQQSPRPITSHYNPTETKPIHVSPREKNFAILEDVEVDKENNSPVKMFEEASPRYVVERTFGMKEEPEVRDEPPATPMSRPYREVTTTTTVPLADPKSPHPNTFFSPAISKAEAIEILRQRRGRARSVATTPKKAASESSTPRRDISAPERMTAATTPRHRGRVPNRG